MSSLIEKRILPSFGIPPRRLTRAITPTKTSSSNVPGSEKSCEAVTRQSWFNRRPSFVLTLWCTSRAFPSGVFCRANSGKPSRLISIGMSCGCMTSCSPKRVSTLGSAMLPKILPPCLHTKTLNTTYTTYATWPPPGKTGRVAGKILLRFPLEAPILSTGRSHPFRWALPSFPLGAPILSAERSHLFHWVLLLLPLEAPIVSTRGSHCFPFRRSSLGQRALSTKYPALQYILSG